MTTIALVEDCEMIANLMTEVLSDRGYSVVWFEGVEDAFQGINGDAPDMVVTDVNLPDGSGLELVSRLRATHSQNDLPVLVVSGLGSEGDMLSGFESGANDYLTKPVRNGELLAKCSLLLAGRGLRNTSPPKDGEDLPGGVQRAFDRYRIERVLGKGGCGIVYSAIDLQSGRRVALKVMGLTSGDSVARERFLREGSSLSLIDHPSVVSVHDFGACDGRLYYAMECLEGPTLTQKVAEDGPASEEEMVSLLRGLASALQALAAADLVHRDLKPDNVVLRNGSYASPVLVDFGLAKRPLDPELTAPGAFVGTPNFTSPEAIRALDVDVRSDLFSLGLVARYACTGKHVFPNRSTLEVLKALVCQPIPIPTSLSKPLRGVLKGLTRKSPTARITSPTELLEVLDSIGQEFPAG